MERVDLNLIVTKDELNGVSDKNIEPLIEELINYGFEGESCDERHLTFIFY